MEFMSNLQDSFDPQKPSLFELCSEQQLSSLIPPTLRYLLAVATHRHPRYLLRALNSFDELYAVLSFLVEHHFLRTYSGSFTENFYGLKRERILRIPSGELPRASLATPSIVRETLKLRPSDVYKNLAILVGIPYLKRKLDESYDIHAPQATLLGANYNRDQLPPNPTLKQRVLHFYKWFLRRVYPSINCAYYASILLFNLAYLFDNTKCSSPLLWLIGTRIRRLSATDYQAIEAAASAKVLSPNTNTSVFHPTNVYSHLFSSLKILLPTSIFALKFLEWWHASDFARQLSRKATETLDLPPPIISGLPLKNEKTNPLSSSTIEKPSSGSLHKPTAPISKLTSLPILTVPAPTPATSHLCPICLRPVVTPTACQTGYVYCYGCIFRWVDGVHERQEEFMAGGGGEGWGDDDSDNDNTMPDTGVEDEDENKQRRGREGKWESGKGRCAVTGRRVLGGKEGLRRVMV
ncbi:MAG: ubiquitin-protein ligase peroxin 12 [Cirrosporium novae-zelandiae]|nr:MAG: ubiquitin-protein ligase peroxin 12 [Cirrosporium novae-zelandiae]